MSEVNNRTLAALLVVAIVVSLGGTFISLNKLGNSGGTLSLTGYADVYSQNGTINLSVAREISIALTENNIDFGSGTPLGGTKLTFGCDSSGEGASGNLSADSPVNWSTSGAGCNGLDSLKLNNTGTVVVNISMNNSKNASEFICGSDATFPCTATQRYDWKTKDTGTCINEQATWTPFTGPGTPVQFCDRLSPSYEIELVALFVAPLDFDNSTGAIDYVEFTAVDAKATGCGAGGCA